MSGAQRQPWDFVPLAAVTEKIGSGATPKGGSESYKESGIALIRSLNVHDLDFRYENLARIDEDQAEQLTNVTVERSDVLLNITGASIARCAVVPNEVLPARVNQHVSILRPVRSKLDSKFLAFFLVSDETKSALLGIGSGAGSTRQALTKGELEEFLVPIPSIDEQRRIVAMLDQAFAALDRARANAEANLAYAKGLFLSALRDVFSNHSSAWPSDVAPCVTNGLDAAASSKPKRNKDQTQTGGREATARPIQGEYSLSVLAPKVNPRRGWVWSSLSSLARLESGHTPSRRHPEYWGGGIGWISIRDAKDHNGETILDTREQTNDLGISNSSARVLPKGTVCLSRTASVGYVVKMGADMATSQDFVNWICGPDLDPDFLMLLLQAQGDDIEKFASGAVHQTIYFPEVKAFHICHPAIQVQRQIAGSLQKVRKEAAKAENVYVSKLLDIAALRQSLLQAAFSGQLT